MPNVLFVGGGSIGHIAPSVAVWQELKKEPNVDAHFVCSPRGEDAQFLEKENCSYTILDAPRLSLSFLWKFPRAYKEAKKIIGELQPDVIFSKGGYVSVPLCMAAKKMSIPIILHESDAVSGRANMLVAKWADHICSGFLTSQSSSLKSSHTGNPIRKEVTQGNKDEGLGITNFTDSKPILLVTCGSQGSQGINDWIYEHLDELLQNFQIAHITGREKGKEVNKPGYWSAEFVIDELPHLYAIADRAISRAGAGTIAELEANGIPTVLIPLRGVGHDHQYHNAAAASESELFSHVEQKEMNTKLLPQVLIPNPKVLIPKPKNNASRQIAEIISSHLENHPNQA